MEMRRAKAFIVMPFGHEYNEIYSVIREACLKEGIDPIRADEIMKPGPIINQIFDAIAESDVIIAEVSSKNPNVYYEIALAHCVQKPSIILATKEKVKELPFDIRHNRVLTYEKGNPHELDNALIDNLKYIREHFIEKKARPNIESYLGNLATNRGSAKTLLNEIMRETAEEYELTDPKVIETKYTKEGFLITIGGAFGDRVVILVDHNGILRRKKRI